MGSPDVAPTPSESLSAASVPEGEPAEMAEQMSPAAAEAETTLGDDAGGPASGWPAPAPSGADGSLRSVEAGETAAP